MAIRTAFVFDGWDNSLDWNIPNKDIDWSNNTQLELYTSKSSLLENMGLLLARDKDILDVVLVSNRVSRELMELRLDLLIIDYGGADIWGSSGLAEYQVRLVCEYAREHPGTLIVLWTDFTAAIYRAEFEEEFGALDNIAFRYAEMHTFDDEYGDLDGSFEFKALLKNWFAKEIKDVLSNRID